MNPGHLMMLEAGCITLCHEVTRTLLLCQITRTLSAILFRGFYGGAVNLISI